MKDEELKDRLKRMNGLKNSQTFEDGKDIYNTLSNKYIDTEKRVNKGVGTMLKIVSFVFTLVVALFIIVNVLTGTGSPEFLLVSVGVLLLVNYDTIFRKVKKRVQNKNKENNKENENLQENQ